MTDIVILDGARTAIGTFGGSLAATPPIELGTVAARPRLNALVLKAGKLDRLYSVT